MLPLVFGMIDVGSVSYRSSVEELLNGQSVYLFWQ